VFTNQDVGTSYAVASVDSRTGAARIAHHYLAYRRERFLGFLGKARTDKIQTFVMEKGKLHLYQQSSIVACEPAAVNAGANTGSEVKSSSRLNRNATCTTFRDLPKLVKSQRMCVALKARKQYD